MKLLLKLNVIFFVVFALALAGTEWVAKQKLRETAMEHVTQNARIMLETAMSMRSYTTDFVAPLLKDDREVVKAPLKPDAPIPANVKPEEEAFHPETVPAFAATESFNYLRKKYPSYTYKEATLNPTNLRDRTTDWEADVVNKFRDSDKVQEVIGQRMAADEDSLYLAHPIKVTKESCLECHSTAEVAPASMIKLYGSANGFGWKLNETVGAQIVSVPMALPLAMADRALSALLFSLVAVFVLTLLVLNVAIYLFVIRPVVALTQMADAVSRGKTDIQDLPVKGSDEIGQMAAAFNRMHRSLAKALKMLDE
jgi:HAMP domain-containing protein